MRAHIVLAHPESQSFNGHLADVTRSNLSSAGWQTTFSDLYGMDFDPCEGKRHYPSRADPARFHAQTEQRFNADQGTTPSDVTRETEHLLACDLLVVHFPMWWFGMPAILKGWIDRVFVYGSMYRSKVRYDTGICSGKKMLACVTTGASAESCAFNGREGDTRLHLWPVMFAFRYLGFDVLEPEIFHGIGGVASIEEQADGSSGIDRFTRRWADQLAHISDRRVTPYNPDSDFDDHKRLIPGTPSHSPFISHTSNPPWG